MLEPLVAPAMRFLWLIHECAPACALLMVRSTLPTPQVPFATDDRDRRRRKDRFVDDHSVSVSHEPMSLNYRPQARVLMIMRAHKRKHTMMIYKASRHRLAAMLPIEQRRVLTSPGSSLS